MGFDANGVRALLAAHRKGADFSRIMMIGRQGLHFDSYYPLKVVMESFGIKKADAEVERMFSEQNGFAEPLLRMLGGQQISSIDASAYEGASIVHDMNLPIPDHLKDSFTLVIDGGSLEHVFNFPVAIKNCMEMVRGGGHFLGLSPANNCTGHGFYQFSPEVYFCIFSERNGFMVERLLVFESAPRGRWFEVRDSESVGERVEIVNNRPTHVMVLARKLRKATVFANYPQQRDYVLRWGANEASGASKTAAGHHASALRDAIKWVMPQYVLELYRILRSKWRGSGSRRKLYFDPKKFKPIDITRM